MYTKHTSHSRLRYLCPSPARPTQSSEPILIPKLRIRFADFPYLHYSSDQRLFTLETCCGYGYGLARKYNTSSLNFQGLPRVHWTPQEPRCFTVPKSLSPVNPIPGTGYLTKKRQLFPGLLATSSGWFALPHLPPKRLSPCLGSGILTRFPFAKHLSLL